MPIPTAAEAQAQILAAQSIAAATLMNRCETEINKAIKACSRRCVATIPSNTPRGAITHTIGELKGLGYRASYENSDPRDNPDGSVVIEW